MEEEGYEYVNVCIAIKIKEIGKWVLDSGCTSYICPL